MAVALRIQVLGVSKPSLKQLPFIFRYADSLSFCNQSLIMPCFQVHILPTLVRNPQKLLSAPHLVSTALSITRSATFLSTFVSSIWFAVCFTRTLVLARLFPWIPHDFWDGPFGCTFVGSLVCGSSIWIEDGRRRGEMALYVLPRAIRACLPEQWIRSRRKTVKLVER